MKRFIVLLCLLLAAPSARADEALRLRQRTSINQIGARLLASHLRHNGMANAMVSGPSLFYGLSVLALGADGASRNLLRSQLLSDQGVEASVADIAGPLAKQLSTEVTAGETGGSFRLSQGVWSTNGASGSQPFLLKREFVLAAQTHYGASHRLIDFEAAGAAQTINSWAEQRTNGLIPSIIDDPTLAKLRWVILNTALFEGGWGTAMQRVAPGGAYRFVTLDGRPQAARSIRSARYSAQVVDLEDGSVAFQLPFAGEKYAFLVHVPAAEQKHIDRWLLEAAIPALPETTQRVFSGNGARQPLMVQLPSFSFSDGVSMVTGSPIAADLGLAPLFDSSANLDRLSAQPSQLGLVRHHSRIELNENGVRAAATTLIGGIRRTSIGPVSPTRQIVVNRPFVFAIVARASQTLLFNGVLMAPPPDAAR
ncbi:MULTISPECIES: serpin family protein [Aphanothece]|uniref:serpin family protein n=1 Tax=Aphanothece TaxID=1121 RepID=UPI0039851386